MNFKINLKTAARVLKFHKNKKCVIASGLARVAIHCFKLKEI